MCLFTRDDLCPADLSPAFRKNWASTMRHVANKQYPEMLDFLEGLGLDLTGAWLEGLVKNARQAMLLLSSDIEAANELTEADALRMPVHDNERSVILRELPTNGERRNAI